MQNQWLPGVFPFWRCHRGKFFLYEKAVKKQQDPARTDSNRQKNIAASYIK